MDLSWWHCCDPEANFELTNKAASEKGCPSCGCDRFETTSCRLRSHKHKSVVSLSLAVWDQFCNLGIRRLWLKSEKVDDDGACCRSGISHAKSVMLARNCESTVSFSRPTPHQTLVPNIVDMSLYLSASILEIVRRQLSLFAPLPPIACLCGYYESRQIQHQYIAPPRVYTLASLH
jgi:hypothetical protein